MANVIFGTDSPGVADAVDNATFFSAYQTTTDLNDIIFAGTGADIIFSGSGDDVIDGGGGIDEMYGGAGNDVYIVDTTDTVNETTSTVAADGTTITSTSIDAGGTDTVIANVNAYTLRGYVTLAVPGSFGKIENLVLGIGIVTGTGNALNNRMIGNEIGNTLNGGAGDDYLDGRAGVDSMAGGAGNDTYVVDTTTDTVTENASEGTDTVNLNMTERTTGIHSSYTVGLNIERVVLTNSNSGDITAATSVGGTTPLTTAVTLIGNSVGNVLTGGNANDFLSGLPGDDSLAGGAGNDNLDGGTGNDSLVGGDGNDTLDGGTNLVTGDSMSGGTGNDIYFLDSSLDVITEVTSATDLGDIINVTMSSGTYTLPAVVVGVTANSSAIPPVIAVTAVAGAVGIDVIRIISTGSVSINASAATNKISLLGNSAVNALTGGRENDTLDGGAGGDALTGGNGNDTYVVDSLSDSINDSAGTDTVNVSITAAGSTYAVPANVEKVTIISTAAISLNASAAGTGGTLTGNAAANSITGSSAVDSIIGGAGADIITGGVGADKFSFTTTSTGIPSITNFDTITDFSKVAGVTFDTISATALILGTQTAGAASGVATITTGVATFNGDDTTFAQHLAAVAAAQQTTAGATTIWQEGSDSYLYISDGTLAVGATDVLIKLVGLTDGALTVAANAITAIA